MAHEAIAAVNSVTKWVDYFFNIWPFLTNSKYLSQIRFKILPSIEWTLKIFVETFKILSKWQNFVISDHTGREVCLEPAYLETLFTTVSLGQISYLFVIYF